LLDAIVAKRKKPLTIVSDNGTELTSHSMLRWQENRGVGWHYIAPGSPWENGFIESFMYRRPRPRKVDDENVAARESGAFMYAACRCGLMTAGLMERAKT